MMLPKYLSLFQMIEFTVAHLGLFLVLFVVILFLLYFLARWWLRRELEQKFVLTCEMNREFPGVTLANPTNPTVFDRSLAYNLLILALEVTLQSGCGHNYPVPVGYEVVAQLQARDPKANRDRIFAVVYQGPMIVVCFPGTITPSEWFDDADITQVPPTTLGSYVPGALVHRGFYEIYRGVQGKLREVLAQLSPRPLIFNGHSLGGALATLAYYDFVPTYPEALLYTFGAPRVGNPMFAQTLDSQARAFRYFNTEDVIPSLPPPVIFGYTYEQTNQNYVFTQNLGSYALNHTQAYLDSLQPAPI